MSGVISAIGHVALRVRDLDATLWTATQVMGLRETERDGDWVYLTHGQPHHAIQYAAGEADAVDHIGLEARDVAALAEIRRRLADAGIPLVSDGPLDPMLQDGLAFALPEDFVVEVYVGMPEIADSGYGAVGVRPNRFGHVNILARDPLPVIDVLERILDFRASDYVAGGAFLRCNVDHHGIAVLGGPGLLHHHAWEVGSIADLARLGDRLDEVGQHLEWGPLRHGAGRNVAAYFLEPAGTIVEYYCDMVRIYDDAYEAPTWSMEGQRWYSLWSPGIPEGVGDRGVPPVRRDA